MAKHTDTSRSGDLVVAMKDQIESWEFEDPREIWWKWQHQYAQAADLIETQAREIERLREALREVLDHARHADSCAVYHPTRKPCSCGFETDDEAARAALAGDSHDQ